MEGHQLLQRLIARQGLQVAHMRTQLRKQVVAARLAQLCQRQQPLVEAQLALRAQMCLCVYAPINVSQQPLHEAQLALCVLQYKPV